MNSAIAILSYRRAERLLYSEGQITLAYLHPSCTDYTYLFVREEEEGNYLPVAEKYGVGLITISDDVDGVKGTRDEILRWAYDEGLEKLIMLDDDLRLDYKPDSRTYIRMRNGEHFDAMIADLLANCQPSTPVVGITARQFSQAKPYPSERNTRIIQVFALYLPIIKREELWFSDFEAPFMSDYAFVLTMLERGYENICLNNYCRDDNSQTPGGCAIYRTAQNASKSAVALANRFPSIVTPYVKISGTWNEPRVNVRIAWKRTLKK